MYLIEEQGVLDNCFRGSTFSTQLRIHRFMVEYHIIGHCVPHFFFFIITCLESMNR